MVIRFPLYQHNAISIRNLVFTIYSRGSLMSKATGGYFYVSDDLVNDLQHQSYLKLSRSISFGIIFMCEGSVELSIIFSLKT